MKKRFSSSELKEMYRYHALPEEWENMEYNTFLEHRRLMMADIVREGYESLVVGARSETKIQAYDSSRIMVVRCHKSPRPIFVKDDKIERFYVRTGPSTFELTASQRQDYIKQRFVQDCFFRNL